jgi:hypothetical protein
LEDVRFPKNNEALAHAREEALKEKKIRSLKAYSEALKKKYVKVDRKLFEGLDYEAPEPGLDKLGKDQRVIAKIKGGMKITVAIFTESLKKKFFHGVEQASEKRKVNRKKDEVLDELVMKIIYEKEAMRLKIDRMKIYKDMVEEHRRSILFGTFIGKAIIPGIKVEEAEMKAYHAGNLWDYAFPETIKMQSLVFANKEDALDAVDKLKKGADFQWVTVNASGQVDKGSVRNLMEFDENVLVSDEIPEGVRNAISGATSGDYRIYTSPEGYIYVFYIREINPARPKPFESVEGEIRKRLFDKKLQEAVEGYGKKMRAASEIEVLTTGAQLEDMIPNFGK